MILLGRQSTLFFHGAVNSYAWRGGKSMNQEMPQGEGCAFDGYMRYKYDLYLRVTIESMRKNMRSWNIFLDYVVTIPDAQCMVYLPRFGLEKYTIHWAFGHRTVTFRKHHLKRSCPLLRAWQRLGTTSSALIYLRASRGMSTLTQAVALLDQLMRKNT